MNGGFALGGGPPLPSYTEIDILMNAPWIIGTLLAIAFFAFFEWRAFRYPLRQNTLSRFIWTIGQNWPLSIWLMGAFAGCLATHLFWHWCPVGSISTGLLIDQLPLIAQTNCIAYTVNPPIITCN